MALTLTIREGEKVYLGTDVIKVTKIDWRGDRCEVLVNKCEAVPVFMEGWSYIRCGVRISVGDTSKILCTNTVPRVVLRFDAPRDVKILREGM